MLDVLEDRSEESSIVPAVLQVKGHYSRFSQNRSEKRQVSFARDNKTGFREKMQRHMSKAKYNGRRDSRSSTKASRTIE